MLRIAFALLAGLLILFTYGIWYFYHELVIIWFVFLLNLVKGITLKTVLAWLIIMLRRWLLIEVPKWLIKIMAALATPRRWRAWVRAFAARLRHHMGEVRARVETRFSWLFGRHVAIGLAVLASVSIFVVGIAYFGVYILYFFGGQHLIAPVLSYLGRLIQNLAFKVAMFLHLGKLARFVSSFLPEGWLARLRSTWYRLKRNIVRRRKAITRWVESMIFGEKPKINKTD